MIVRRRTRNLNPPPPRNQVAAAPAREAGEKIEDDGEAYQRVVAFLEELKVV